MQEAQGRVKDLARAQQVLKTKGILMPWQRGYKENLEKRAPGIEDKAKEMSADAESKAVEQVAAIASAGGKKVAQPEPKKEEAKP